MRGRPIIDIKTFVQPEIKNIDPSKKGCPMDPESKLACFSFETCCKIESLVKSSNFEVLQLNYVIEAETFAGSRKFSRVFFGGIPGNHKLNIIKKEIKITKDNTAHCQKHLVYIKENTRDIQSATHATLEFEAGLLRDCGDDDVCESDVVVGAALALPKGIK